MSAKLPLLGRVFVSNNLYERNFFERILPGLLPEFDGEEIDGQFNYCRNLFAAHPDLDNYNESQLEDEIIKPILSALGWSLLSQETKIISGLGQRIDISLFTDNEKCLAHTNMPPAKRHDTWDDITVLVESKRAGLPLDTKKVRKEENPYFQLLNYLQSSKIDYGFLTNGRQWWFLDNSALSAEKRFLAFYLDEILAARSLTDFSLFWRMFHVKNFTRAEAAPAPIALQTDRDRAARFQIEEDLRRLIYGDGGQDSIFEDIGRAIFEATGSDPSPENLRLVFENSLYFIFRLVFVAFFECRHKPFLRIHRGYQEVALWKIVDDLQNLPNDSNLALRNPRLDVYNGWYNLKILFKTLDRGEVDLALPLLDGGLFNKDKAKLLNEPRLFSNGALLSIFSRLLRDAENNERDFSALSIAHLGTIYEGLLEFEFRIADEALQYIAANTKDGRIEGYFDAYDLASLELAKAKERPDVLRRLAKGSFYLVSTQNNRKVSGSYYTPESLSRPLVEKAISQQLEGPFKDGRSITEMRILDNACGSGHILIEALNVLTLKAQERLAEDQALRDMLYDEHAKIEKSLKERGWEPEEARLDEFAVLKRILLKKVIFGVDLSPFAVELAQLALWIDTFIFGTPLSFIEHHLKAGNSLIGTTIDLAEKRLSDSDPLFGSPIKEKILGLKKELRDLNALNDNTQADIEASKSKYYGTIQPLLNKLNWYLDVVNHLDILSFDPGRRKNLPPIESLAVDRDEVDVPGYPGLIDDLKNQFGFFNWEVEFPEAFIDVEPGMGGFNLIIGNPPWDKTKFEDPLFFSQYRSNYRSLKESAKKNLAADLLNKDYIREKYDKEQSFTRLANAYYKNRYPLNRGVGDGNLYRFFVERNLGLLAQNGSLNYVLPTALLTEDGSTNLRQSILENYRLNYFDGFENRESLFPEVDSRYKFGLIQIENKRDSHQKAKMRFMLTDPAALKDDSGCFDYSLGDLKAISPEHWAYAEARGGQKDIRLLKRMYAQYAPLEPEWLDFRNELHATGDKKIFKEQEAKGYLPLYKGASIWQFHARYAEPEYWLDPKEFDAYLRDKEINRLVADIYPGVPFNGTNHSQLQTVLRILKLKKKEDLGRFIKPDRHYVRLGFRDIARDTDERTLVAALAPRNIGAQNTLWMSIPKRYRLNQDCNSVDLVEEPLEKLLFTLGLFCSLPVDWILRFSVAIHVNKTYLTRLPLPQPDAGELARNQAYKDIIRGAALLSLYNTPQLLPEVKSALKIKDSELIKTPKGYGRPGYRRGPALRSQGR